jgi:hypothetical protein
MILSGLMLMIMVHQFDRKRSSKGVGRVGLTASV